MEDKNEIICFCAGITLEEIQESVTNGHTTIPEIRTHLDKQESGQCKTTSPTGKCCHGKIKTLIQHLNL